MVEQKFLLIPLVAKEIPEGWDHFDNIAEVLEDSVGDPLASELMEKVYKLQRVKTRVGRQL